MSDIGEKSCGTARKAPSPRAMRYPLEQVRRYTRPWRKCTNAFHRSEERRKLSMTIARAMEALPATRSLSRCCLDSDVSRVGCLDTKYGGGRRSLQRLFGQVLVSGKSSMNVSSVVARITDETPTSLRARATNVDHVGHSEPLYPVLRAGNHTGRWTGLPSQSK